jgi:hypothetical protein
MPRLHKRPYRKQQRTQRPITKMVTRHPSSPPRSCPRLLLTDDFLADFHSYGMTWPYPGKEIISEWGLDTYGTNFGGFDRKELMALREQLSPL